MLLRSHFVILVQKVIYRSQRLYVRTRKRRQKAMQPYMFLPCFDWTTSSMTTAAFSPSLLTLLVSGFPNNYFRRFLRTASSLYWNKEMDLLLLNSRFYLLDTRHADSPNIGLDEDSGSRPSRFFTTFLILKYVVLCVRVFQLERRSSVKYTTPKIGLQNSPHTVGLFSEG